MANHKSARKRANQNEVRRLRNKAIKTRVKNVIKNLKASASEGPENKVIEMLNIAQSVIDNAAKKGILHKKTASRKVSRLSKMVRVKNISLQANT